uniref:Uncharacterized protein n=1 Tax=Oryza brachyantha TaxID=4533 RepID=J3LST4_ORYBR
MAEPKTNGVADVVAPMMLHGRVAIVTGGAGGIGSAVSKHLTSLGARVAVAYVGDPAPAKALRFVELDAVKEVMPDSGSLVELHKARQAQAAAAADDDDDDACMARTYN